MISVIYSSSVATYVNHVCVIEWQSSQNQVRTLPASWILQLSLISSKCLTAALRHTLPHPTSFWFLPCTSRPVPSFLLLLFLNPERHRHLNLTAIISSLPSRVRTGVCGPVQHLLAPCRPSAHYPLHRSLLHWWTIAATNSEQREVKKNG